MGLTNYIIMYELFINQVSVVFLLIDIYLLCLLVRLIYFIFKQLAYIFTHYTNVCLCDQNDLPFTLLCVYRVDK